MAKVQASISYEPIEVSSQTQDPNKVEAQSKSEYLGTIQNPDVTLKNYAKREWVESLFNGYPTKAWLNDRIGEALDTIAPTPSNSNTKLFDSRRSNDIYVAEFIGCLRSYFENREKLIYGLTTPIDNSDPKYRRHIDCSSYIIYCLNGIPFSESPYKGITTPATDSANDISYPASPSFDSLVPQWDWAINLRKFMRQHTSDVPSKPLRTASQICEWMEDQNWSVEKISSYDNIQRGDIIFYALKDDDGTYHNKKGYKHVSHVAVVAGTAVNNSSTISQATHPILHPMFEVNTVPVVVQNRYLEDTKYENIASICRPKFGAYNRNDKTGSIHDNTNAYTISDLFDEGLYFLTSSNTESLPNAFSDGNGLALKVEKMYTIRGKVHGVIQTLSNLTGAGVYRRSQLCSVNNYTPLSSAWTEWNRIDGSSTGPEIRSVEGVEF